MFEKVIKYITTGLFIVVVLAALIYFGFIYLMGHNFVHKEAASSEYYDNINNRIYFTTKFRGEKFNNLLDSFLNANPKYIFPDTTFIEANNDNDNSAPESFTFTKSIYFNTPPIEAYKINYGIDTMYSDGAGILDIVYERNNNKWTYIKSSKLDSAEKNRIKNRLDTAILKKIN